jgi:UDP-N-acetylmuramate: L-alanyl-gamma-D-glutamyl-meso-diaminopimelate ligase
MRIYFMGICGTAMGNAALLLKEQGHEVMGADVGVYPPMSDVLAGAGIEVLAGFDSDRLARLMPDQVVVGNAMSRGNVEVEWLLNQSQVPYVSLPELFHRTVLPGRCPVVVAGTHGKTTTATLSAYLLDQSGARPGWLIGGVPNDLPGGSCLGEGTPFVIEGDEYDSAFFDKRSKFIHYRPKIAVLNNLEFDHADIFRDLDDVKRTFRHFLRIIPGSGYALVNGDDENLLSLLPVSWTQVLRVGTETENDLQIDSFRDGSAGASFDLIWGGKLWHHVEWSLHGLFNARNAAMASLAAALASGFENPVDFDLSALAGFSGVRRRQDVLFRSGDWAVLEDFAHHPTAVEGAILALKAAYPGMRMRVCFEPRSNTAASSVFQAQFTAALSQADTVYLGPVHRAERMRAEERLDTQAMAQALTGQGTPATAFDASAELFDRLKEDLSASDAGVVVFFTNGVFDGLPKKTADLASGLGHDP